MKEVLLARRHTESDKRTQERCVDHVQSRLSCVYGQI